MCVGIDGDDVDVGAAEAVDDADAGTG